MRTLAVIIIAAIVALIVALAASCDAAPSLWQAVPGGSSLEFVREYNEDLAIRGGVDVGGFIAAWKKDKWGALKALAFDAIKGGVTVWAYNGGWIDVNIRIGRD